MFSERHFYLVRIVRCSFSVSFCHGYKGHVGGRGCLSSVCFANSICSEGPVGYLRKLGSCIKVSCIILGNFNKVLGARDKQGGAGQWSNNAVKL